MRYKISMCFLRVMFIGVIVSGCTSDPYASVNQTTPIRQMDNAFDPSGSRYYERTAPPAYSRGGYDSPSYRRY